MLHCRILPRICCQLWVFPHYQLSQIPSSKWRGWKGCKDRKGIVNEEWRSQPCYAHRRSTPLKNGLSLSELLMGRRLRTQLPVLPSTLVSRNLLREREEVAKKEEISGSNHKRNFHRRRQVQELPDLTTGESVWIEDQDRPGKVQGRTQHPRSYTLSRQRKAQCVAMDLPLSKLKAALPLP